MWLTFEHRHSLQAQRSPIRNGVRKDERNQDKTAARPVSGRGVRSRPRNELANGDRAGRYNVTRHVLYVAAQQRSTNYVAVLLSGGVRQIWGGTKTVVAEECDGDSFAYGRSIDAGLIADGPQDFVRQFVVHEFKGRA